MVSVCIVVCIWPLRYPLSILFHQSCRLTVESFFNIAGTEKNKAAPATKKNDEEVKKLKLATPAPDAATTTTTATTTTPAPTGGATGGGEKEKEEDEDEKLCKICMDAEINICFVPCGHLAGTTSITLYPQPIQKQQHSPSPLFPT